MRRLIIDDWRVFNFAMDETTYVRTNDAARVALQEHWDEVWFDYDMGLPMSLENFARVRTLQQRLTILRNSVTYPLALEMEEHPERYDIDHIYIHTGNPDGAERLQQALRNWNPIRVMLTEEE